MVKHKLGSEFRAKGLQLWCVSETLKPMSFADPSAGLSRSSGSFYNAFQPYRPEMVPKIVDIARVYFNWVEPRSFRLAGGFQARTPTEFDTSHLRVRSTYREQVRRTRREDFSTPAIRLGLVKRPLGLETILYEPPGGAGAADPGRTGADTPGSGRRLRGSGVSRSIGGRSGARACVGMMGWRRRREAPTMA